MLDFAIKSYSTVCAFGSLIFLVSNNCRVGQEISTVSRGEKLRRGSETPRKHDF